MARRHLLLTALLSLGMGVFACKGDQGPPGESGDPGTPGDPGDPGTPAETTGTLTGVVTDGVALDPLEGVAVTAADAGGGTIASTTTDVDGGFSMTLAAGPVDLSFAKASYTSPGVIHSGVGIGQTVTIAVAMSESDSGRPSVSLLATGNDLGYGATAALSATATDPNGDELTYEWANTTAPALGEVSGTGASGTMILPTMNEAFAYRPDPANPGQYIHGYVLEDRFGIVPIIPDTRGQVTARVTVSDGRGQAASASLTLSAASPSEGVRNVPVGARVYLNSGHDADNAWAIADVPATSTAALDDVAARTPSFVPDIAGEYTLTEGSGPALKTITITAGRWRGAIAGGTGDEVVIDAECMLCHGGSFQNAPPDMFTPWLATGHATMFTRGINGEVSDHYAGSCVGCHTVGHDDGVDNGGFDDAVRDEGWSMPSPLDPDCWTELVAQSPGVAKLANVQCENCHGPQSSGAHIGTWDENDVAQPFLSPRISYAAEACATCHGAGAHHIYSEWATPAAADPVTGVAMGHSNREGATTIGAGATGMSASCGRCHTAQGYTLYAGLLGQGKVSLASVPASRLAQVTSAVAQPITCVACHDPHDATNPNQLRFYDDTPNLPAGFAGHGMGKGALCLTCHNSRNGAQSGSDALTYLHEDGETYNGGNPTGYSAPHMAAQGDVFAGHNAYFMGANMPMTSKHAAVTDTCVGCHMTLQPKGYMSHGAPARSGHLFRIEAEDRAELCASCHGSNVDGAGIQGQVHAKMAAIETRMGTSVVARVAAVGGVFRVRAWDPATDLYSSSSSSSSNVVVDATANPIVAVHLEEIHGQVGLSIRLTNPITIPFVTGSGAPAGSKDMSEFGVQLGSFKDNQAVPVALYALSGNFIRAGWNYFLVHGDQSEGLHNPTFVLTLLNNTLARDLAN